MKHVIILCHGATIYDNLDVTGSLEGNLFWIAISTSGD